MTEIEKELRAATKIAPKKGEAEQPYLKRLFDKANGLDEDGWSGLSEEAQLWCNAASEARETKSDIPGFGATAEAEDESSEEVEQVEETESEADETEVKNVKSTKAKSGKKPTVKAKTAKPAKAAKPTEKAAKAAKAKPTKAKANGAGPRKGSLTAKVAEMLQSKKGCTRADILAATGWPSVSVQQLAANAGLKLRKDKEGRIFRYRAD